MEQTLLTPQGGYRELDQYWRENDVERLFLVCGPSIRNMPIGAYFDGLERRLRISVIRFSDFRPNPDYECVVRGIRVFQKSSCNMIAAVGGGSAMDVAKCIKLWNCADLERDLLGQRTTSGQIKLLATPTTAGSGSEATRFAVLYHQGRKLSISDENCLPSAVMFDPSVLYTLPDYPKKAAMLDALCHGIESYWSIHSTEESRGYSRQALRLLLSSWEGYLNGDSGSGSDMLLAAHLAGKAINIAKTTAGHAMCYQLTSRYGAAHGHAAALCVSTLWPYMLEHIQDCIDPRGPTYLCEVFQEIADAMGCDTVGQAAERFQTLLQELGLRSLVAESIDFDQLTASVAPERLCNHPVMLDASALKALYRKILYPF